MAVMGQVRGGNGASGISSLTQVLSPTTDEGNIIGKAIPVTSGKYYAIVGAGGTSISGDTYSVSGGTIVDTVFSQGVVQWGSTQVKTVILIVKATSSSMTVSVASGSYPTMYAGQAVELD